MGTGRPRTRDEARFSRSNVVGCMAAPAVLMFALPPKAWFHGSQSTRTGLRAATNGQTSIVIWVLAVIISWLYATGLGVPVEPEVSRILVGAFGSRWSGSGVQDGGQHRAQADAQMLDGVGRGDEHALAGLDPRRPQAGGDEPGGEPSLFVGERPAVR